MEGKGDRDRRVKGKIPGRSLQSGKAASQDLSLEFILSVTQYPGFTHHAFVFPVGLWRKTEDQPVGKRRDAKMDRADKHCHHDKQTAQDVAGKHHS
jgi:hypothetical protein